METERPPAPLLVIISGKLATGKTTLGRRFAADLSLPFFFKDGVKETLFDALDAADRASSRRLGVASFTLLRYVTEAMLSAGQSLMIEANCLEEYDAPFYQSALSRHGARIAQVWLTAAPETILARFEHRAASPQRHSGHVELAHMDEFRSALQDGDDAPLPLGGALLTVDTTDFATIAYHSLLNWLRSALDGANTRG
ncbi:MAG TPA: AAA family ATPase [Ktedonobacterales bacterium]|nr:AAA family ATPase [Ktedonobacterales bacterium]